MTADADSLNARLIGYLRDQHVIIGRPVEAAFLAVPRHLFLPGVALKTVYAPETAVVTKRSPAGAAISSASAPRVVATMLEQLDIRPGQRILEIGAGTGYNAALLAELTGPDGLVTTIDLDQDIVDGAVAGLAAAGHREVQVVCGDGDLGHAAGAPFDRIIVTVGAWDLPSAWLEQLAPEGRIVVPLRILNGTTRVVAFEWQDGHLAGRSITRSGFVPMRGAGTHDGATALVLGEGDVTLVAEDPDPASDLTRVLDLPSSQSWTGVVTPVGEAFGQLDLWLALTVPGFCRLVAEPPAIADGRVDPAFRWSDPAVVRNGALAYLTARAATGSGPGRIELGVRSHSSPDRNGPGTSAAHRILADQVGVWAREHAGGPGPHIEIHPGRPDLGAGYLAVPKRQTTVAVSWPTAAG